MTTNVNHFPVAVGTREAPLRDRNHLVAALMLACTAGVVCAGHAFSSDAGDSGDDERTTVILRSLHPYHPPNVQGLRLTATGTGFFVAPGVVLTNFHVAGSCKALTAGNNMEGKETAANWLAGDARVDLAILASDDPQAKPAQFQTAPDQRTGAEMAIVGYPEHGLPVREAELDEVVASPDDLTGNKPNFPFGGAVRRGNSGSPVLDGGGAVLGIVRAKINTVAVYHDTGEVVDRIGFAISDRTIVGFLRANHVAVGSTAETGGLTPDQLLEKAHDFVRQIGCWN